MPPIRASVVVPLALAGAVLLGGCGEDDDGLGVPTADPGPFCDLAEQFDGRPDPGDAELPESWRQLADIAPAEIRDDVGTVADAFATAAEDDSYTFSDDVNAAGDRVIAYLEDTCGLDVT